MGRWSGAMASRARFRDTNRAIGVECCAPSMARLTDADGVRWRAPERSVSPFSYAVARVVFPRDRRRPRASQFAGAAVREAELVWEDPLRPWCRHRAKPLGLPIPWR